MRQNSQTLYSVCNREKSVNEVNFLVTATSLHVPKELKLLPRSGRKM